MHTTIFSKAWALDTLERACKSAAQGMLLVIGAGTVNVLTLDWPNVAGAGAGMALLSLLTSVGSVTMTGHGTASLTRAVEPSA